MELQEVLNKKVELRGKKSVKNMNSGILENLYNDDKFWSNMLSY